jgi:ornithine carbamoyltransferase
LNTQHFLTGKELNAQQTLALLQHALLLKKQRVAGESTPHLSGQHLALLFDKPSLRTRFSFTVAMRELGGDVVESITDTRKAEEPEDQARVLAGYCKAIMMRTHEDSYLERMAQVADVPVINGLSDLHHPCQILADLLTLLETFKELKGLTLTYIGDGNNILHSLLLMAPGLGVNVHYCCPKTRQPDSAILEEATAQLNSATGQIHFFSAPVDAVKNAHAVYTDVWTSMGFEASASEHLFDGFQVNEALMSNADPRAIFMHCLPMVRGKEVSETLADQSCSAIFQQSENRLHAQKALLLHLLAPVY